MRNGRSDTACQPARDAARGADRRGARADPDPRRRDGDADPGPRLRRGRISAAHALRAVCDRHQQGNNDLLILTQPEAIEEIHYRYAIAGADILETNTFSSTAIAQADYGMGDVVYELNREGARLVRRRRATAPRPRTAGGASSPARSGRPTAPPRCRRTSTTRASAPSRFDDLRLAYGEQLRGLIDGGADLILIETIFDTLNAKAAIFACEEVFAEKGVRLPVMISGTITDLSGRTLSGQTPTAFWHSVRHARPFTVGLNCALGADGDARASRRDRPASPTPSPAPIRTPGCRTRSASYDESPEFMAAQIEELRRARGC